MSLLDQFDVLTPGQLMQVLQLKHSRFCELQKQGAYRFLEVKRPIGRAKYSSALVKKYVNGDSPAVFIRRTA